MRTVCLLSLVLLAPTLAAAQPDPVVGNWRGSLKTAAGTDSPLVIAIARSGDRYVGATNGVSEGADVALRKIEVTAGQVSIEAAAESRLGLVVLSATLTALGNRLSGEGALTIGSQRFPVTFTLQRRLRTDVTQHQVDQNAGFFVGRWKFEYVGGEFPPLSSGSRQGSITFAKIAGSGFVSGTLQGESFGASFEERLSIGVDPDADTVVLSEKRADGIEFLSLGNWRSPLAIVFATSPVQSDGRSYQLRRVFSILSESSFDVTEEFSVDGGPLRRLGAGHYTKQ